MNKAKERSDLIYVKRLIITDSYIKIQFEDGCVITQDDISSLSAKSYRIEDAGDLLNFEPEDFEKVLINPYTLDKYKLPLGTMKVIHKDNDPENDVTIVATSMNVIVDDYRMPSKSREDMKRKLLWKQVGITISDTYSPLEKIANKEEK